MEHDSKFIIVDAERDRTGGGVDNESRAAEVVADEAIGLSAFAQVVRGVGFVVVDELGDEVADAVEFGDGFELLPLGRVTRSRLPSSS